MIERLLKKLAQYLDRQRIPYMIIGGQAVLLYGRPRLTRDIDITLGVDTDKFGLIEDICQNLSLRIHPEDPEDFARQTNVLPADEPKSKIRVDFIFSFSPYEAQAIKRAKEVIVDNYPAKFASCEDVIIHKMVAGRAVDEEDVRSILAKNKGAIDYKYIRTWLSEFGKIAEHEGVLGTFNDLLKAV